MSRSNGATHHARGCRRQQIKFIPRSEQSDFDKRRSSGARYIVVARALSDVATMPLDRKHLSANSVSDMSKRGTASRYSAVSIRTGARRRRTPLATLKTSLSRPRHEKSMTTSWCRKPLPPFTSPRSRIKQ
ncbi:hypothetical protein [Bradyrhizobium embrapense]